MIRGVPYDAEVEYLESTGTQWIDTGIKPSEDLATYISFAYTEIARNISPFGCRNLDRNDRYWVNYDSGFEIGYGSYYITNVGTDVGTINVISFNEITNGVRTFIYNGVSYTKTGNPNTSLNIMLFGRRYGSTHIPCKMRLYSFSMKLNGVLVRNLIPVRFTNTLGQSEGAVYDRMTRCLFRNQGAGAFLYGADVATSVMGLHVFQKSPFTTLG